ncbi:MAG TPA: hypothetical protein ENI19_00035 [Candidatus Nealsonbacteria bacterium]|uniref:DUF5343 domain-containing protein n=1 Tax=marine sediment metagenome TaxID=412755 RepID=A0A0F9VF48_9ZZZZ|nr:hypothetical protein [Candidatus Nealsonbacteria bacterium]HEB46096.1 hypothetical protein [Candidatus Nealsonbacteria bacterium]
MAKEQKKYSKLDKKTKETTYGNPQFPYCTVPKSLRKFLEMIPGKPKPPKINGGTLKVWGLRNANDQSILRVLKKLDLLSAAGEPTTHYTEFMKKETGASVLGERIKVVYETLFQNVKNPEKAATEELTSFFNINSGGGEKTIRFQVDTFKALADHATFDGVSQSGQSSAPTVGDNGVSKSTNEPVLRIDLHIHLPENKSKADYDAIIESIANRLYKINGE